MKNVKCLLKPDNIKPINLYDQYVLLKKIYKETEAKHMKSINKKANDYF